MAISDDGTTSNLYPSNVADNPGARAVAELERMIEVLCKELKDTAETVQQQSVIIRRLKNAAGRLPWVTMATIHGGPKGLPCLTTPECQGESKVKSANVQQAMCQTLKHKYLTSLCLV
jgi:hypothetical protein